MSTKVDPITVDRHFFASLMEGNLAAIDLVLAPDFLLIDAMHGNVIRKTELLTAIDSGALKFQSIEPVDVHLHCYPGTAIVTGETKMRIQYQSTHQKIHSRYTHVYIEQEGYWRLVNGQGTRIPDS